LLPLGHPRAVCALAPLVVTQRLLLLRMPMLGHALMTSCVPCALLSLLVVAQRLLLLLLLRVRRRAMCLQS
jgi:hypothetical protein